MALHVRALKLNVTKFSHLRLLPFCTKAENQRAYKDSSKEVWICKAHQLGGQACRHQLRNSSLLSIATYQENKCLKEPSACNKDISTNENGHVILPMDRLSNTKSISVINQCYNRYQDYMSLLGGYVKPKNFTVDDILLHDSASVTKASEKILCSSLKSVFRENHKLTILTSADAKMLATPQEAEFRQTSQVISIDWDRGCEYNNVARGAMETANSLLSERERITETNLIRNKNPSTDVTGMLWCQHGMKQNGKASEQNPKGPTEERLQYLQNHFVKKLPRFFKDREDYSMCNLNIIFENNFFQKYVETKGLASYIYQMKSIKILSHLKYAHVKLQIVSISNHPEDGTIRLRWRVSGMPQLKSLLFWKFLPWTRKKTVAKDTVWHDGFSVFWVGSDGMIYKHRVDRVIPDEAPEVAKSNPIGLKLAAMTGLTPKVTCGEPNVLI